MIRRLVEAHYFQNNAKPTIAQVKFWLTELRTPQLLLEVAQAHDGLARRLVAGRPFLASAIAGKLARLDRAWLAEEKGLRAKDKTYWLPLLKELECMRHPK